LEGLAGKLAADLAVISYGEEDGGTEVDGLGPQSGDQGEHHAGNESSSVGGELGHDWAEEWTRPASRLIFLFNFPVLIFYSYFSLQFEFKSVFKSHITLMCTSKSQARPHARARARAYKADPGLDRTPLLTLHPAGAQVHRRSLCAQRASGRPRPDHRRAATLAIPRPVRPSG
jgi:hypothetical protein